MSLFDMLPYPVWQMGLVLKQLGDIEWTVKRDMRQADAPVPPEVSEQLTGRMSYSRRHCVDLELLIVAAVSRRRGCIDHGLRHVTV